MKKTALILIIFFLAGSINADEDKNYIMRKKIQETRNKIEEFSKNKKETDEKIEEFRTSHARRMKKRKADIAKLETEVSELEKELKMKNIEKRALERGVKNKEIQFASFRNKLENSMQSYNSLIMEWFPYNREERSLNVKRLVADTEFENIIEEELFNRYNNFLNKELLLGLESEVYVKDNVKYLRIGWMLLAYSNERGEDTGIITLKNDKWTWNRDLNFEMRKAVRDSIKMVEGKKAPDIILYPVPLSLVRETLKGAAK